MDDAIGYRERRSSSLPATIWTRHCAPGTSAVRPDGCMDLIWDGSRIFVAGPDTEVHDHRTDHPQTLTAIRLSPGIAPIILGSPASELTDMRVDLADVARRTSARWEAVVADARAPGTALEQLVSVALADAGGVPDWIGPVVGGLRVGDPIAAVAVRVGLSPRQLRRRCVEQFGYGPKLLQRILRVQDATRSLRSGARLSDTAHRHGYADYSHMFREFRSVLDAAPADFRPPDPPDQGRAAQRSTGMPSGSSTTA